MKTPSKHAITRRRMLRGLAGGSAVLVGLPVLDAMLNSNGNAFADGGPLRKRIVTWCFGNGTMINNWVPGGIRNPVTGYNYPLGSALLPLQPVQEYVSVLSGFTNKCKYIMTHHEGMTVFNGYTMSQDAGGQGIYSNARGPTIDQIYANAIDAGDDKPAILRGVHTGIVTKISEVDYGTTMHNVSHVGHLNPNPPIKDAQAVYQQFVDLFVAPEDPSKPARLAVVDSVLADAKELQKRLGAVDKGRIDGHLAGLADLQHKIDSMVAPACQLPGQPTVTIEAQFGIDAVNKVMSDLIAFAFSCDATRIGSVLFCGGASEAPVAPGLQSQHSLSHSVSHNALPGFGDSWLPDSPNAPAYTESGEVADYQTGITAAISHCGYLLQKLKDTPDAGDTNLLDNSVVFVSSDCSFGSHDIREMPILVCGKAGGALKSGIHLRSSVWGRNTSDVLLTVLQALVPEAYEVGSLSYMLDGAPDPAYSNTPYTELKA